MSTSTTSFKGETTSFHDGEEFENNEVIDDIQSENVSADVTNLCKEVGIDHRFMSMDDAQFFIRLSQCKAKRSFRVIATS